jgi:hypothetical protein
MNKHRFYLTSKRVGDPSSKYGYDYDGSEFDKDIADKEQKYSQLKEGVCELINERIEYNDGRIMSGRTKLEIIKEVFRELYEVVER